VGIGIAGTLPFPWGGTHSQPEGWIENVLQTEPRAALSSPGRVANVLEQRVRDLTGVPFGNGGVILVAGFEGETPEIYDLWVQSRSQQDHSLEVQVRRPNVNPLFYGCLPSWDAMLVRTGRHGTPVPARGKKRRRFLKRIMESAIRDLRGHGDHNVALPVIVVRIPNTL
jgi:hypothetical protein